MADEVKKESLRREILEKQLAASNNLLATLDGEIKRLQELRTTEAGAAVYIQRLLDTYEFTGDKPNAPVEG